MFSCLKWRWVLWMALVSAAPSAPAGAANEAKMPYPGIGRAATPQEVAAWDIDVRPDFKGLPAGSGTVAKGQQVWETHCASCHGIFGESNEVFSPLIGGTTKADIQNGRVASLVNGSFPGRTTLMRLPTISTLWDYINRAMPWNAPKSLTTEEVYAVTAFMLHLGGVVPDNFTLSNTNMADVQKLLPNRGGMTTAHSLWPGKAMGSAPATDVKAAACMKACVGELKVTSFFPDSALGFHGDLAAQQRTVGPQRGLHTGKIQPDSAITSTTTSTTANNSSATSAMALAERHSCTACHGMDAKLVGPGFAEIAAKYAAQNAADGNRAELYLTEKIKAGGQGTWGSIPMPSQSLSVADAKAIAKWLAAGAKR
jgi:S-disulfanyl-L-cysteine oxidoreductase SoxD